MTYRATKESSCVWIEYRQSSTQTISTGSIITFDTKRSSGADSVSINSSTGVVTLSASRRYWIQACIAIQNASNLDWELEWEQSNGTALTPADGSFSAYRRRVTGPTSYPFYNSSYVASLIVNEPSINYRLKVATCAANSTVLAETHLFIMELN